MPHDPSEQHSPRVGARSPLRASQSPLNDPCDSPPNAPDSKRRSWGLWACLVLSASVLWGCSHSKDYEQYPNGVVGVYEAQPPAFLNGPMSVLLTNRAGYAAHVTVQGDAFAAGGEVKSGQLYCRGNELLFAPVQMQKKQARSGGFAFIWNVADSKGYVLSGALQGYAPVSSSVQPTNVVLQPQPTAERIDGHPATRETAVVQMSDGSSATFEVWRASDLNGLPLRISTANPVVLTLTFSDLRPAPPPDDVFALPDDFTKYSSPEALADEVAARQHNLHRKNTGVLEPMEPINPANQPPRQGP